MHLIMMSLYRLMVSMRTTLTMSLGLISPLRLLPCMALPVVKLRLRLVVPV